LNSDKKNNGEGRSPLRVKRNDLPRRSSWREKEGWVVTFDLDKKGGDLKKENALGTKIQKI
jgi:hypothetical protein